MVTRETACPNCGLQFNVSGDGGPYRCPGCTVLLWMRGGIFWPMADDEADGGRATVAQMPDTRVILDSPPTRSHALVAARREDA